MKKRRSNLSLGEPVMVKRKKEGFDLRIKIDGDMAGQLRALALAGDRPLMAEIRRAFKFYLENHKTA